MIDTKRDLELQEAQEATQEKDRDLDLILQKQKEVMIQDQDHQRERLFESTHTPGLRRAAPTNQKVGPQRLNLERDQNLVPKTLVLQIRADQSRPPGKSSPR